jgi:adenylate kinase
MRLLLIGAPGAGKGTQAGRLATRFGIAHISSGDLLRQHVRDQTSLGRAVQSYVANGDLVPDGVVMDMLRKPVLAAAGGYVLDGFPRTVEQAKASYAVVRALGAEVQAAIHLDVPREELVCAGCTPGAQEASLPLSAGCWENARGPFPATPEIPVPGLGWVTFRTGEQRTVLLGHLETGFAPR